MSNLRFEENENWATSVDNDDNNNSNSNSNNNNVNAVNNSGRTLQASDKTQTSATTLPSASVQSPQSALQFAWQNAPREPSPQHSSWGDAPADPVQESTPPSNAKSHSHTPAAGWREPAAAPTPPSNASQFEWGKPAPLAAPAPATSLERDSPQAAPVSQSTDGGWGQTQGDAEEDEGSSLHKKQEPVSAEVSNQMIDSLVQSMQNVSVQLADKQQDVNSPLFSAKTFEELGLSQSLLRGIYAMKFVKPSKVQERALPLLLSQPPTNMIAQSQSGTGKTAAFVLTMLHRVDPTLEATQAICLAPTRELARQILQVAREMGQFIPEITSALISREDAPNRAACASHILVGTPGTLLAMENRRQIDLAHVRVFVLDEADVMLDKQGMGVQSMRLRKLCPPDSCQLLLFSATFSEPVMEFAKMLIPNANMITLKREEVSVQSIKQYYIQCASYTHKIEMLSLIYGLLTIGQSIIFIATRASAEQVYDRMTSEGHLCSLIHGGMSPSDRDRVIDEFRSGHTKVLLATNVLARGIDVLQVSLVVNFDMPMTPDRLPDPETYVHRIGRTGRFGRSGVAINFVHNELSMHILETLEEFFGREIIRMPTESIELLEQRLQNLGKASGTSAIARI